MKYAPAPTTEDIEAALTRRIAATPAPEPVQEPATVAAPDDYAPVERANSRRRWLDHYALLCDYAERAAWLCVILASFIALIAA